jgi:thiamine-phosphate pyrophosphorylase
LQQVLTGVSIAVVAIGGIKAAHLGAVAAQGARHCAVVTALTGAEDISASTRHMLGAWRDAVKKDRV